VIVGTCNRAAKLRGLLESLAACRVPRDLAWEIVVSDNRSTDDTRDAVERFASASTVRIRYLYEPRQGKSVALNRAIRTCRSEVLAFTDDDVRVDRGWIEAVAREFDADPKLHGLGGRVEPIEAEPGRRPGPTLPEGTTAADPRELPLRGSRQRVELGAGDIDCRNVPILGCNMAFRRECLEAIGLFDERLGPGSAIRAVVEDVDLLYRFSRHPFRLVYAPDVVVYHDHGRVTAEDVAPSRAQYLRGRGAFYAKFVLRGDLHVVRCAYWETRGLVGALLRSLGRADERGRRVLELRSLAAGALAYASARRAGGEAPEGPA